MVSLLINVPEAVDCHMHLFRDGMRGVAGGTPFTGNASLEDYRKVQDELNITRHVIVQPSTYGFDNSLLIENLLHSHDYARGVVVIDPSVSRAQLRAWHQVGVRGIRMNLVQKSANSISEIGRLSELVAPLGWHIELNIDLRSIIKNVDALLAIQVPLVFDHVARLDRTGLEVLTDGYDVVARLLGSGRNWIKVTAGAVDHESRDALAPKTIAATKFLLEVAPERVVWGTDWPHATRSIKPDDVWNFNLLEFIHSPDQVSKMLTSNAYKLYEFSV